MKWFSNIKTTFMLTLTVAALGLSGCAHNSQYSEGPDDKATSRSIDTALHRSRGYSYPDVKVASRRGIVYLEGAVDYQEQKTRAERIARSVDGVKEVVSNIAVRQYPTGRTPAPTSVYP